MKKLASIAAIALVAACSEPAPEADTETAATEEVAAPAEAEVMAADGASPVGMYTITGSDGKVWTEDLKADGTYTSTDETGKVVETGRWVQKTPEEYCYTVDEQYVDEDTPAGEQCNVEGIDAEGKWTSTGKDGKTAIVARKTA